MAVLSLSLYSPLIHSLSQASSSSSSAVSSSSSSSSSCSSICGRFSRPYPCWSFILKRPHALRKTPGMSHGRRSESRHVVCMAPEEEKITRRSPLDFPIEWERPKPGRRPDIFPQFSPMKTPLPPPLPADPPEEDEEDEEKKEEEEEDPEKEETDTPEKK